MKKLIPALILILFAAVAYQLYQNPPKAKQRRQVQAPVVNVEVMTVSAAPYQVILNSYGKIRPRTQSPLLPQVSGEVVWINPDFRNGSFFEKDELLLKIDDRNYRAEAASAEAALQSARQKLEEEKAQSRQAAADWKRLGNKEKAPALVLRQPQLNTARAEVSSARAARDIARLNLSRTRIRAPYTGRILEKNVDIGQVVSSNSTLASIYAVDYVEVRLPLQNRDLQFIDLPERYRFETNHQQPLPDVTITSELVGTEHWQGQIVQTEGAIDDSSRQLYVVAQIDDPYGEKAAGRAPLKVGQYVTARIAGRTLDQAIVIPNRAIYQGSYIYRVEDNLLRRTEITIEWQNGEEAIVSKGLKDGDQLVLTALGQVISGTAVRISEGDSADTSIAQHPVPPTTTPATDSGEKP
ncbi:efflux RND transporter periplasmic adaptor subunit [Marinobacterium jannaschii]|uniref:efflux RND transporter periplasmic adaptor subunit n=1 Tax=Marinobacterium jannaschii TaxID=64970 RepID=UPI000B080696|nr:efflux RND transporter periplasmic adaptor subunit [Marinobacterium jannaschii]